MTTEQRLSKVDWFIFGLKTLSEQGVDSVRIEPMAKCMKVTKGSFYWHFKNRNQYLAELLGYWERIDTSDIITELESRKGSAEEKLKSLFERSVEVDGALEEQIRAWSASDPRASEVIQRVDRRRIHYIRQLFKEIGFAEPEAKARTHLIYYALVGQQSMSRRGSKQERLDAVHMYYTLLIRPN